MHYICINGFAVVLSASKRIWKQKRNYFISDKCHCHCLEYIPNATDRHINSHLHMHINTYIRNDETCESEKEKEINTRSITFKNAGTVASLTLNELLFHLQVSTMKIIIIVFENDKTKKKWYKIKSTAYTNAHTHELEHASIYTNTERNLCIAT